MAPALDAVLQPGDSILEFGAGVGAVIERALPLLKRHQAATYWFTDLGAMFVQQARRRYQDEDILRFSTVDLNRPLEGQGFPPGSLNVLTAVNTAHVAKDLPATARSLYDSLATPGWLLLGEASPPNKHALARQDLIAGFLPGWWDVIIDPLLRPRPGFLLPSEWEAILRGAGFSTVACIPGERTFTGPCRGGVILAGKGTSGPGA
jgi:SAM-dependent methyltransferase